MPEWLIKRMEADFKLDGIKVSAVFHEDGRWLETEQVIRAADLPKAVAAAIKTKYPSWKIAEADKTESSKLGAIYEVDLIKGKAKKARAFKADRTLVHE
jgi:Putative beta-lactamase-inhibitor-like, PepSY-like